MTRYEAVELASEMLNGYTKTDIKGMARDAQQGGIEWGVVAHRVLDLLPTHPAIADAIWDGR